METELTKLLHETAFIPLQEYATSRRFSPSLLYEPADIIDLLRLGGSSVSSMLDLQV